MNVPVDGKVEVTAMRIGEVAAAAGVPTKTIRFWESLGLVPAPARTPAGYRDYAPEIAERLRFIRHAQGAGLRLDQIGRILEIGDAGDSACEHVAALIAAQIAAIDERIAELTRARGALVELARRAEAQDPADCRGLCKILQPRGGGP